jgi:hypothetical protein
VGKKKRKKQRVKIESVLVVTFGEGYRPLQTDEVHRYPKAAQILDHAAERARSGRMPFCIHLHVRETFVLCPHHPTGARCILCHLQHELAHDDRVRYFCDECGTRPPGGLLKPYSYQQDFSTESAMSETKSLLIGPIGICRTCRGGP